MKRLLRFILCITLLPLLAACNLDAENVRGTPTPTAQANIGKPTVQILSPQDGEEFVVNTPILMSVQVTDTVGVTSVRLAANGTNVRTVGSESPTGETNKQVLLDYTPRSVGEIVLSVTAVRGVGGNAVISDPAEIRVIVRQTSAQVTATPQRQPGGPTQPVIDPRDPTCRALVMTALRFRRGPSINFDVIRTLAAGELLPVVARLNDNSWWQLRDTNGMLGWVARGPETTPYINLYGTQCVNIPGQNPPVTPTSQPTATPTLTPTVNVPTNTPPPQPTATPTQPDLTVTNISGPTSVVIPAGESSVTVQYGVNITNQGGTINAQFNNAGKILPADTPFDLGVVSNLGAGVTISLQANVTFTAAGSYILQFTADSGGAITESNEVNNSGTLNVTVTNAP